MDSEAVDEQRLIRAWSDAAEDLGIRVVAPFDLTLDGDALRCIALVPDFGHRNGTLVIKGGAEELQAAIGAVRQAKAAGYGCSFVASSYATYDRELFVDTLNDWGWQGDPENAPVWYSGHPWTD